MSARGDRERAVEASAERAGPTPTVARLVAVGVDGVVRVLVAGHGEATARLLTSVSRRALARYAEGRELLVVFEQNDPARPIVVGVLEDPVLDHLDADEEEHRVFEAKGSITLVSGEASLTLHADGRVVTRGVNVMSVASEQQRIQGAVVRIN